MSYSVIQSMLHVNRTVQALSLQRQRHQEKALQFSWQVPFEQTKKHFRSYFAHLHTCFPVTSVKTKL